MPKAVTMAAGNDTYLTEQKNPVQVIEGWDNQKKTKHHNRSLLDLGWGKKIQLEHGIPLAVGFSEQGELARTRQRNSAGDS